MADPTSHLPQMAHLQGQESLLFIDIVGLVQKCFFYRLNWWRMKEDNLRSQKNAFWACEFLENFTIGIVLSQKNQLTPKRAVKVECFTQLYFFLN